MTGKEFPYSISCVNSQDSSLTSIELFAPMGNSSSIAAVAYQGMISEKIVPKGRYLKATFNVKKIDGININLDRVDLEEARVTEKDFPLKIKPDVVVLLMVKLEDGKQIKRLYSLEPVRIKPCGYMLENTNEK
jgi:hypothetical protein